MQSNKQSRREGKRLFRMCFVEGAFDEHCAKRTAKAVAAGGARDRLAVLAHFLRLVKLDLAMRTATVESATPMPAELRAGITAALARRYGPALAMTFVERPSLIGGVRIQVGCNLYDGSVLASLAALEKAFEARNP
jgi:F-type H+-transporting ATPase subunit delta